MKLKTLFTIITCLLITSLFAQTDLPTDYLSSEFHKERREALRASMPENSVAVFFANPTRNRSNDVDYLYHQDPNFYYLTGYKEPHAMLLIFSETQQRDSISYNELIFIQERNAAREMWTGRRLGVERVKEELGFEFAYNGNEFNNFPLDFTTYDKVLFFDFKNDVRNTKHNSANLHTLIQQFKTKVSYKAEESDIKVDKQVIEVKTNIDVKELKPLMASLREIKTKEELVLLKKAINISAIGQIEVMKAMHPEMSELEVQGVHEFVYKKYGAEYEGYPSIAGAGNNGCILHYIENSKTKLGNELVLMDLGAEYHGYTADVTRTIPANGKFSKEQKLIYDIVYEAQELGIKETIVGNTLRGIHVDAKQVINEGLYKLGIITTIDERHSYFPTGTSHHIGLDVHDWHTSGGELKPNMVITVEPGIYIPIGSPCDKKWWGIAARIEDDILITENGPVNLSALAPRTSEEIEEMMGEASILNAFTLPNLD